MSHVSDGPRHHREVQPERETGRVRDWLAYSPKGGGRSPGYSELRQRYERHTLIS